MLGSMCIHPKETSMKLFSMLAAVLALSLSLTVGEAEAAKRLGGGSSLGMQRQATPPAAAPASAARPATAAPQAQQPKRSWMGPLAGLAAGLGLAALASHLGFGEELASMMMIGLLVMAVLVVVGMVMRKRAAAQRPALAGAGMQYAGADPNASARPFEPAPALNPAPNPVQEPAWTPAGTAAATPGMVGSGHIPADFDVASFERTAKVQFIRLQAANDAGNLDDLRAFTTPEMFAELKMNLSDRGAAAQQTEVVHIDAQVLDVDEEAARYVVSVRFSGQIREDGAPAEAIDEIWHLVKPRYGNEGWRLAGIQQAQ